MDGLERQMEMLSIKNKEEKWIKHYSSSHKILLVGEGDFSFAACLGEAFGSAANMVATSLDSKVSLVAKYSRAAENLKKLEDLGCTILHGVDAHIMSNHPFLLYKYFDRIVFNFPHAGFHYYREHDIRQIKSHQKLVKGFLRSASDLLVKNGEGHVTHKTAHPFDRWDIEKLAEDVGLHLIERSEFFILDYPGYWNKRGDGDRADHSFPVGACSTFKFGRSQGRSERQKIVDWLSGLNS